MRAVKQGYLTFVVRSFRRYEQYVQAGFISREFFRNFLRSFDNPQVEDLCLYYQVVIILKFFFDSIDVFAGEARYDTVNQRCINTASFFKPCFEFGTEVPKFNVLVDGFFQFVTVKEDQLAWEDDKSLALVAIKGLETMVKQLS
ncbi:hypothetical protein SDC9_114677 [bioreactor metagenome]|uniref:Uncharacterized protein n=1 Tax=bioreactor metagenome TaxID=1076179 RepID=A0A645BXA7_9ZZZZ